jgi:hypothetical protein
MVSRNSSCRSLRSRRLRQSQCHHHAVGLELRCRNTSPHRNSASKLNRSCVLAHRIDRDRLSRHGSRLLDAGELSQRQTWASLFSSAQALRHASHSRAVLYPCCRQLLPTVDVNPKNRPKWNATSGESTKRPSCVDETEDTKAPKFRKAQQSSTRSRHLIETECVENGPISHLPETALGAGGREFKSPRPDQ